MAKDGSYLGRVQVLRFFAATAVLFAHLQHEVLGRLPAGSNFTAITIIDGGFGVDLFFVISGFIMYHVASGKFGQPGAVGEFLLRRYMRIAPLYYLATILMLVATFAIRDAVSIAEPDVGDVVASFLFIPTLNAAGQAVPVLKLGWTLNFEAYFYVVFGLALAFSRRTGLLVLALSLSTIVLLANFLPRPATAIAFWGQSLVFEFLGGVAIAILHGSGFRMSRGSAWLVIVIGLVLLAGLRMLGLYSDLPRAIFAGIPAWLIVTAVVSAPFDEHNGRLKRLLVAGGEASYAIYVIHPFGIRAGTLVLERFAVSVQPWLYVALLMAVVIACAFIVNQLVERPLDRWLRRLLDPARTSREAVAVHGG
jgi:peptidoglycan/LPS O-acetylase OafA/YrhL